jgi:hypothetical protein
MTINDDVNEEQVQTPLPQTNVPVLPQPADAPKQDLTTSLPDKNVSDSDLLNIGKKLFPQWDPEKIAGAINVIKQTHPDLTNDQLAQMVPALQKTMQTGSFQNLVVQQKLTGQIPGAGNTGTLPANQQIANQPIAQPTTGGGAVDPYYVAQANALARYPDAAKSVAEQGIDLAKQSQSNQESLQNQDIKAQGNAQANVAYQQNQNIIQQKMDPESPVNKLFQQQLQSFSKTPIPNGLTVANAGDLGDKFFDMYIKKYSLSGLPTVNSEVGKQVADINPANLDTAKTAVTQSLNDFQKSISNLPAGTDKNKAATLAVQLYQAEPGSKEAIAAEDGLNLLGAGGIITAMHGLTAARNLVGDKSGQTDYSISQGIRDSFATNNLDALDQSIKRTGDLVNNNIEQLKNKKNNFYANEGFVNNNTVPTEPVKNQTQYTTSTPTPAANNNNTTLKTNRIKMISPDGKIGSIVNEPEQIKLYQSRGYKLIGK